MAKGIENLEQFGEPLDPMNFTPEASDQIRSMAILEGCSPAELIRRALGFYDNHLELRRQDWDGPLYQRNVTQEKRGKFGRITTEQTTEMIRVSLYAEGPPTVQ